MDSASQKNVVVVSLLHSFWRNVCIFSVRRITGVHIENWFSYTVLLIEYSTVVVHVYVFMYVCTIALHEVLRMT